MTTFAARKSARLTDHVRRHEGEQLARMGSTAKNAEERVGGTEVYSRPVD